MAEEEMSQIDLSSVKDADKAGLKWLVCCGVKTEDEARKLGELLVEDELEMAAELKQLGLADSSPN